MYVKCEKPYELVLPDGSKVMVEVTISEFIELSGYSKEELKRDRDLNLIKTTYNVKNIKVLNQS